MSKEVALVLSNKVNVSDQFTQVVELCGNQSQIYEYSPDGGVGPSSIQWNSIVPIGSLGNTLLSKNMKLRYTVSVSVTPTANPVNHTFPASTNATSVSTPVNSGFRAFPLQSVCNTIQLSINNSSTTWNARQTLDGLQRLLDKKALMSRAGESPCRPDDKYNLYPDASGFGQVLNISSKTQTGYSRNSITARSVVAGPPIVYTYEITEDLVIPGINSLFDNEQMYGNINTMALILSFTGLKDMVVQSAPYTNNYNDTLTVAVSDPYLVLEYVQVDPNLVSIPKSITYPYENIQYFPKDQSTFPADMQANVATDALANSPYQATSDTIRLNSLPKRIGFYVRQKMNDRSVSTSDSALTLQNAKGCVQINLGARSGLLAQASRDQVWRLSVQAGSNQTRDDFCFGSGSFTWIDPVIAFGVNAEGGDLLVGESGSLNLQIQANYTFQNVRASLNGAANTSFLPTNAGYEMIICVIYDGQMIITPDMVIYNTGILTAGEIDQLVKTGSSVSKEAITKEINGAGLYTNKSVLHKGAHSKKKVGGVITMA
jgi:hypothetical protein